MPEPRTDAWMLSLCIGGTVHSLLVRREAAFAVADAWKKWLTNTNNTGNELLHIDGWLDAAERTPARVLLLWMQVQSMEAHHHAMLDLEG